MYEYLTRAADELVMSHRGSMDEAISFIKSAANDAKSPTDVSALLGVVSRALVRVREVRARVRVMLGLG
jgi:cob(I)alamin adenosyltransferase